MFLALDIGNTHSVIGLYEGDRLTRRWRLSSDASRSADEYRLSLTALFREAAIEPESIDGAMICSVLPRLSQTLGQVLETLTGRPPDRLDASLDLGFANRYHPPEAVGPDRLANAVGGLARHGAPLIVLDLGTATTFDVLSRRREYLGGVILPGLEMSADALFQKTSLLPRVSIQQPPRPYGDNTLAAINAGLIHGSVGAVDHIARQIRRELDEPDCPLIATGGYAEILAGLSQEIRLVDPDLTLHGIHQAWKASQS